MKNGVLTTDRKKLLLTKGSTGIRFRRYRHREGTRIRKLVRGCIVSPDIKMLNLKIVKTGSKVIPGLSDPAEAIPKRLAPKTASGILKDIGLLDIYKTKKQNAEERKTLRYMITKFANKREVKTANGKVYVKRPKIQRLITPLRLRRKRVLKKAKEENVKFTADSKKTYEETYRRVKSKKGKTTGGKKAPKKN